MGQEATEFFKDLFRRSPSQKVIVELDVQGKDKYGRTLAYIYQDTGYVKGGPISLRQPLGWHYMYVDKKYVHFINASIIKSGYATPMTIPPNVKYAELFKELYEEAREQKRGLWAESLKQCNDDSDCVCLSGSGVRFIGCSDRESGKKSFAGSYECSNCKCVNNVCEPIDDDPFYTGEGE